MSKKTVPASPVAQNKKQCGQVAKKNPKMVTATNPPDPKKK